MGILVMVLDLIEDQVSHFLVLDLVKMYYFFWVDMSSSAHIGNKKKDILVLGKGPTQVLEHTLTLILQLKEILFKFTLQWSK